MAIYCESYYKSPRHRSVVWSIIPIVNLMVGLLFLTASLICLLAGWLSSLSLLFLLIGIFIMLMFRVSK